MNSSGLLCKEWFKDEGSKCPKIDRMGKCDTQTLGQTTQRWLTIVRLKFIKEWTTQGWDAINGLRLCMQWTS